MKSLRINNRSIGDDHPVYFIADIAANHDGSLSRAIDLIHLAAESGACAAKFQHFTADTIISKLGFEALGNIKSHQSNWKKSVYQTYSDASLNSGWTSILYKECEKANIDFFSSPYSIQLVDEIDEYVPAYKIGSGDITWIEIIKYIATKQKTYMLATGASSLEDVVRAVEEAYNINANLCLMQCNTNYTAEQENFKYINLNVLKKYKEMFPELILGLSDHTPGHATVLGAIALGARVIEKHFTDDVKRMGPDHKFSMNPGGWKEMVARANELDSALGSNIKKIEDNEKESSIVQRRSLYANKTLSKGHILQRDDISILRPCPENSIHPYEIEKVIGMRLKEEVAEGIRIQWKNLN